MIAYTIANTLRGVLRRAVYATEGCVDGLWIAEAKIAKRWLSIGLNIGLIHVDYTQSNVDNALLKHTTPRKKS